MFCGFLILLGLLCVTIGCYQYSPVLGWIVGGMSLLFWAVAIASAENDKAKKATRSAANWKWYEANRPLVPKVDKAVDGDKQVH